MPVTLDIKCTPRYRECRDGLPKDLPYFGTLTQSYYRGSCLYRRTWGKCGRWSPAREHVFNSSLALILRPNFQVHKYDSSTGSYFIEDGPFDILGITINYWRLREWYPSRGSVSWRIRVIPMIYYVIDIPRFCISGKDCVEGDLYLNFHIELILFRFLSAERVGTEIRCECYSTDYYDLDVWDFSSGETYTIRLKPGYNEIYLTNCPKIKILRPFEVKLDLRCLGKGYDWKFDWAMCGRYRDYEEEFNKKKEASRHYAKYFISDYVDLVWNKFPAAVRGWVLTEDLLLFDVSNYL